LEQAPNPNGVRVASLAPGVIDTDMQSQLRSAAAANFPDHGRFVALHMQHLLASPETAAAQVLAHLERPDFGETVVVDVRD
jgi:NAD(P)-dependent dehydrogenase (short-subunit alcohol dehydrogenase family)